jgi:hypothetical protein
MLDGTPLPCARERLSRHSGRVPAHRIRLLAILVVLVLGPVLLANLDSTVVRIGVLLVMVLAAGGLGWRGATWQTPQKERDRSGEQSR